MRCVLNNVLLHQYYALGDLVIANYVNGKSNLLNIRNWFDHQHYGNSLTWELDNPKQGGTEGPSIQSTSQGEVR